MSSAWAFVVGRNRVHDDTGIDIGIHDANSRNVLYSTFTYRVHISYWVEEDDEVGSNEVLLTSGWEELSSVREDSRQPSLSDVISLFF